MSTEQAGSQPHAGRLLRWGLPRDPQAVPHLVAVVVSAVATILITRGLLAATGYPQLGGSGLHVAHVLWGGLLMVAALVLLISFAGPVVRPGAAIVGGAGFGLFIDEVGKFVTSDNDYFYRPAFAIMYAVLVLLLGGVRGLLLRRPQHPAEHLAGAVDAAVAGVAGGFTPAARAQAHERLRLAGHDVPGSGEAAALLAAIPDDPYELYDPVSRGAQLLARAVGGLRARPLTGRVALVLLPVHAVLALVTAVVLVVAAVGGRSVGWVPACGVTLGSLVTAGFLGVGFRVVRADRSVAFHRFQRAVLASLLLTQVFSLAVHPILASLAVGVDLLLFVAVRVELYRLRQAGASRPTDVSPWKGNNLFCRTAVQVLARPRRRADTGWRRTRSRRSGDERGSAGDRH